MRKIASLNQQLLRDEVAGFGDSKASNLPETEETRRR